MGKSSYKYSWKKNVWEFSVGNVSIRWGDLMDFL